MFSCYLRGGTSDL